MHLKTIPLHLNIQERILQKHSMKWMDTSSKSEGETKAIPPPPTKKSCGQESKSKIHLREMEAKLLVRWQLLELLQI